ARHPRVDAVLPRTLRCTWIAPRHMWTELRAIRLTPSVHLHASVASAMRSGMTRRACTAAAIVALVSAAWADAPRLPPPEEAAKDSLNASPRHAEFATVDVRGVPVRVWVVHPERKDPAPVVVVIHEIFGLTDWIRAVADQIAAEGFLAVAPDLLSGKGPGGGGTEAYPSRDAAVQAVSGLAHDEVMARLDAVRAYALKLPAAGRRSASIGFCWGGSTSFAWAAAAPGLDAAVVYYGTAPADLAPIKAPVLGLYGGSDARVGATVAPTEAKMKELGKTYEPHTFKDAGHGFLRAQSG